jgi:hypothetical protein
MSELSLCVCACRTLSSSMSMLLIWQVCTKGQCLLLSHFVLIVHRVFNDCIPILQVRELRLSLESDFLEVTQQVGVRDVNLNTGLSHSKSRGLAFHSTL